jgi:hypothetical protein
MYRTAIILRYTFREAIVQPIYALLLALGAGILVIFGALPFFTLGEDTKMYKSVGLDIILLVVLLGTLFSTSKSIFDEIEDRTMLTLMSKPVRRWEVILGKYLGIIAAALLGVLALGVVLILATWLRIPTDYQLRATTLNDIEVRQILELRLMHVAGLIPSLFLLWLQISVLAAIGVTLSTRFSLVVNLPAVILLYIFGNLTRFLFPLESGPLAGKPIMQGIAWTASLILPYLQSFDLRDITVLGTIRVPHTRFDGPGNIPLSTIFGCVAAATAYAVTYITFTLSAGMWIFHGRELGGGEG